MLQLKGLTKQYGGKLLFEELDFQFPTGEKIALIGANGAGKTTLLNIITGKIPPDRGDVRRAASQRLGFLPQQPNPAPKSTVREETMMGAKQLIALEQKLQSLQARLEEDSSAELAAEYGEVEEQFRVRDGYMLQARAEGILHGLGFSNPMLDQNPTALSGGWRMRVELAKVLLDDPEYLLLDEPTNHLDLPSLMWIENYLERFAGTVLFVSHDRALLNRLPTFTVELRGGRLTGYPGNLDKFFDQRDQALETQRAQKAGLQRRKQELQTFVDRFGAKASKARQAQSRVKMIERLKALEDDLPDTDVSVDQMVVRLPEAPKSGRTVLETKNLALGYESPLIKAFDLQLEKGMRVAIIGANGIGKSTLLKTLSQRLPKLGGTFELGHNVRLGYCPQNHSEELAMDQTVLQNIANGRDLSETQMRTVLGQFLIKGDEVYKPVSVLSGGEKSRVGLVQALLSGANFLLLDEPTNHLDMSSAEILAEALTNYTGTLLFVSHDRTFINSVATHVLALTRDGNYGFFEGDLNEYPRLAEIAGFPNVLAADGEEKTKSEKKKKVGNDEVKQLQKTKRRLDGQIKALEKDQAQLQAIVDSAVAKMYESGTPLVELQDLQKSKDQASAKLEKIEEQWLAAMEELEKIDQALAQQGRK